MTKQKESLSFTVNQILHLAMEFIVKTPGADPHDGLVSFSLVFTKLHLQTAACIYITCMTK